MLTSPQFYRDNIAAIKNRIAAAARSAGRQPESVTLIAVSKLQPSSAIAAAYAADQLFATLDTTTRRVFLPTGGQVVISDTVGFIRELPHTLVAAFRATLEEAVQADVLLHVVDGSSPTRNEQIAAVNAVLAEIGAADIPQILVYNKIDLSGDVARVERDEYGKICAIRLSAQTGAGLDLLRSTLEASAAATRVPVASSAAA